MKHIITCKHEISTGFSYRWLGVILYLLFLFVVTVVLLNVLIAQFNNSYQKEYQKAHVSVTLDRAVILSGLERSFWVLGLEFFIWCICRKKLLFSVRKMHNCYGIIAL